jgi:fibronectin type 3 domain-containing protein
VPRATIVALFALTLTVSGLTSLSAQDAPAVFVLPAGNTVEIILGDVPREVEAFTVSRIGPDDEAYTPITPEPVAPVADPRRARELMGNDFPWIARRVGSVDPDAVYRKLLVDDNLAVPLSLVSPGLRNAMGLGFSDPTVRTGETYRYRIALIDYRGETLDTVQEEVTAGPPASPEAPQDVSAEAGDREVVVRWEYPVYRGGTSDTAVGFLVYRRSGDQRRLVSEAPVLRIEGYLTFIDREVEEGVEYRYEVETVTMVEARSEAAVSNAVTPTDSRVPLVPEDLTASEQGEAVRLVWRISPEPDVAGYNVFRSSRLKGDFEQINEELVSVGQPSYVDADVSGGDPYYYRVSALDTAGNESPQSGVAVLTPADDTPPGALAGVELRVEDESRAVTLTWPAAGEEDLEGYFIYRGETRDELVRLQARPLTPSDEPTFTDAGFEDRGLRPGASLVYAVAAVDSSFNVGPKAFAEAEIPDNDPPPAPYSLSARPSDDGGVVLRWHGTTVTDLEGHRIYRRTADGASDDFELVHIAPAGSAMWEDAEVDRGQPYAYRLTHVDEAGNESKPSNEAELVPTDLRAPSAPGGVRTEEAERGGVIVSWETPGEGDVLGYRVYRAPYPGGPRREITEEPVADTEYEDRSGRLANHYSVSAVDTSGNEGPPQPQETVDDE